MCPCAFFPSLPGSGEWFTEGDRTRRAVTPLGRFTVKQKIKGWHKSPLGVLYFPNYIYGGVAIHGNPSVPPVPALDTAQVAAVVAGFVVVVVIAGVVTTAIGRRLSPASNVKMGAE